MTNKKATFITLLAVSTLSLSLQKDNVHPVLAENLATTTTAPSSQTFTFKATVLAKDGKTVSGKTVTLTDVTDGSSTKQLTALTDINGIASFTNLSLSKNYSVSIDGVAQGYTVRTDQADSVLTASFYSTTETGKTMPSYSKTPLTVTVRNEEGEALSGQKVALKDPKGNILSQQLSDQNGQAIFSDGLMDGTIYTVSVNNLTNEGVAKTGDNHFYYLKSDQIVEAKSKKSFTFTASVLAKDGKAVSGKTVTLTDITDGVGGKQITVPSDENGNAVFTGLELARNYSVSIDGHEKGYTLRTDQNGANMRSSFYSDVNTGNATPTYSSIPLTVTVRDEDGNPISGQKVTLKDRLGNLIGEIVSDKAGQAVFKEGLFDGTFYNITVNGLSYEANAMPGDNRSYFLKPEEIHTGEQPAMNEKTLNDDKKASPKIAKTEATSVYNKIDSPLKHQDKPVTMTSETNHGNKADNPSSNSEESAVEKGFNAVIKHLPQTGDKKDNSFLLLGSLALTLLTFGFMIKEKILKNKSDY